jgi:hypothetical protein
MNMEIGSYIGLDLNESGEYYNENINIARLNSARAGIYHACKLYDCHSVYMPFYLCPTVKKFLLYNGLNVIPYFIDEKFEPVNLEQKNNHAVLLVNYFGILSIKKVKRVANRFKNVIIDNSAAFFSNPIDGCYSIYSPRKFFGVPDGSYVIGDKAERITSDYARDFSSETASFLFKRIEFGTSATYDERMKNEERIDNASILNMSNLTRTLLKSIDYYRIKTKRFENFLFAHTLYKDLNLFDPTQFMDEECIPMVYPLVLEDLILTERLIKKKIYVGRLWKHVLNEVPMKSFEARLSKYMVPIPIDQRYGKEELVYVYKSILDN